ncbi:MAG: acyl-CoA/acyl-ACP dehydrogenase [Deltaproteobacteria bacterium]|nr:acyl-CoA/acyl-ACP dehydrogenase [Deltaproteobacteria bacterium]
MTRQERSRAYSGNGEHGAGGRPGATCGGGASYFKRLPLERHYRDVRAGLFHPFDSDETLEFLGKSAFGIPMMDEDAI